MTSRRTFLAGALALTAAPLAAQEKSAPKRIGMLETLPIGQNNANLVELHKGLKELGHDPGPIDGRLGLQTQAALKAFQTDYGLAATGEIDAETRAALGLGRKGPP